MADRDDDHGVRGGVCEGCELPNWMCEGLEACKKAAAEKRDHDQDDDE